MWEIFLDGFVLCELAGEVQEVWETTGRVRIKEGAFPSVHDGRSQERSQDKDGEGNCAGLGRYGSEGDCSRDESTLFR